MIINKKKLLTVKQILFVSTLGNVESIVWRVCILMLGCKGLIDYYCNVCKIFILI